ncbi:FAD-dependent oxidoreductase [Spongiactinospora gelatinilytica]|uniref:FAD-dependent oxidoreductase n=1 Tax=Spongiactinospora gelatinilytica TaxID=2666298 RepID=UPI001F42D4BB|nr:FAD-dependent oxidoreductase [Spongiactinospora gelatinilytica]
MNRHPFTRRTFVDLVGRAGGAGAAYGTLTAMGLLQVPAPYAGPPKLTQRGGGNGVKVAVIGAGISGMVAALELSAAQYQVRVFEAQDRVGAGTGRTGAGTSSPRPVRPSASGGIATRTCTSTRAPRGCPTTTRRSSATAATWAFPCR